MSTRNYFILCAALALIWVPTLLFVPAVADTVEQLMLKFLSTNAG